MGWAIGLLLLLIVIVWVWNDMKKRKALLDGMSPEDRKRFLENEKVERKAKQEKWRTSLDEMAAKDAMQQIAVAKAEGRKYARVWVAKYNVDSVTRWAERQHYTVLRVKEGQYSDVQLSISGF